MEEQCSDPSDDEASSVGVDSFTINYMEGQQQNNPLDHESKDDVRKQTQALFWLRLLVLSLILVAIIFVASAVGLSARRFEIERYDRRFQDDASSVVSLFYFRQLTQAWLGSSISGLYRHQHDQTENNFPLVYIPDFDLVNYGAANLVRLSSIWYSPIVTNTTKEPFEAWVAQNQDRLHHGTGNQTLESQLLPNEKIFQLDKSSKPIHSPEGNDVYSPILQILPFSKRGNQDMIMFDQMSEAIRRRALTTAIKTRSVTYSSFLDNDFGSQLTKMYGNGSPRTIVYYPVFEDNDADRAVVGTVGIEVIWETIFRAVVLEGEAALRVVLDNGLCGGTHTFELRGRTGTKYLGEGDLHDPAFGDRDLVYFTSLDGLSHFLQRVLFGTNPSPGGYVEKPDGDYFKTAKEAALDLLNDDQECTHEFCYCEYNIHVYPTREFKMLFLTRRPLYYALVVCGIFAFAGLAFLGYDRLVERRQNLVMDKAVKSSAIVYSLFPPFVRDRLFLRQGEENRPVGKDRGGSAAHLSSSDPHHDGMLDTTTIAWGAGSRRLKKGGLLSYLKKIGRVYPGGFGKGIGYESLSSLLLDEPIAEAWNDTTVLFADIAGFTAWSSAREPVQVFQLLESLYRAFDEAATRLGVFKVETIGDCYMAVTGLPTPRANHAIIMCRFAYECQHLMRKTTKELEVTLGPGTSDLGLRVGVHSGSVTAGVLRSEKARFQLFGDTVNTASRMESTGERNMVQVSETTANLLVLGGKDHWLEKRSEMVDAKGKGKLQTYWVVKKPTKDPSRLSAQRSILTIANKERKKHDQQNDALRRLDEWYHLVGTTDETFSIPTLDTALDYDSRRRGSGDESSSSHGLHHHLLQRHERLIDWSAQVLHGILVKVVSNRKRRAKAIMLHRKQSRRLSRRGGSGVDEDDLAFSSSSCTRGTSLSRLVSSEFNDSHHNRRRLSETTISAGTRKRTQEEPEGDDVLLGSQLREFVSWIASRYKKNTHLNLTFHSFEHASHVALSVTKLLHGMSVKESGGDDDNDDYLVSSASSSSGQALGGPSIRRLSDPIVHFVVVIAALMVGTDIAEMLGHRGDEQDDSASTMTDKMVTAPSSASSSCSSLRDVEEVRSHPPAGVVVGGDNVPPNSSLRHLLKKAEFQNLRRAMYSTPDEEKRFHSLLSQALLATSSSCNHGQDVKQDDSNNESRHKAKTSGRREVQNDGTNHDDDNDVSIQFPPNILGSVGTDVEANEDNSVRKTIELIMQVSTVSHTMQHWHLYRLWDQLYFEELVDAYTLGRKPDDPRTIDWYERELSNFDGYVIPLAKALKESGIFGSAGDDYLHYAAENRHEWKEKGRAVSKQMMESSVFKKGKAG